MVNSRALLTSLPSKGVNSVSQIPPADTPNAKVDTPNAKATPRQAEGWLTREEAARLLGMSTQTIRNYEGRGFLSPQRVPRPDVHGREQLTVVYDPRDLVRLKDTLRAKAKGQDVDPDTDTSNWLTRNECIDTMAVSRQTLKNYEKDGRLHPRHVLRSHAGGREQVVVVYDPNEISKLPRGVGRAVAPREIGELTARCYELFEQGKSFREIVIQLRQTSDRIREMHERWLDDDGADLVITPEAKKALEALVGPFKDVAMLIERLTVRLSSSAKNDEGVPLPVSSSPQ